MCVCVYNWPLSGIRNKIKDFFFCSSLPHSAKNYLEVCMFLTKLQSWQWKLAKVSTPLPTPLTPDAPGVDTFARQEVLTYFYDLGVQTSISKPAV